MKKANTDDDELRSEYDLSRLRIRAVGPDRAGLPRRGIVLDPDVAARFPDSEAVNEALRALIQNEDRMQTRI